VIEMECPNCNQKLMWKDVRFMGGTKHECNFCEKEFDAHTNLTLGEALGIPSDYNEGWEKLS